MADLFDRVMVARAPSASTQDLVKMGEQLQKSDAVDYVYLEPLIVEPPDDILPVTPDYRSLQTYRDGNIGMNADYAWAQGVKGADVRISDCEYGWNYTHEDLVGAAMTPEPGQTPSPFVEQNGWDEHGTAVVGVTSAPDNGFGVTGLATEAAVFTYPEHTIEGGARRAEAIASAIANSRPGDVVMLEMQTVGPGGGYAPAELDPVVWDLVKKATDAGIIVVGAAGNGSQDLDSADYAEYRSRGDSGAILVGAGTPDATHGREGFSTYGSRVNVQGFGTSVATTGYGDLATHGNDRNQRYTNFSGTSSATPCVASAVVLIQSFAKRQLGRPLSPQEMRDLLVRTGTPQGDAASGNIGPLPNVKAAMEELLRTAPAAPRMVISEVSYNPVGDDRLGEFIELYNPGTQEMDLTGWSLGSGTQSWRLPEGTRVAPGSYLTIARNEAGFENLYGKKPGLGGLRLGLSNRADSVTLSSPEGRADEVTWGKTTAWNIVAPAGKSLHRQDLSRVDAVAANWEARDPSPG